MSHISFRDILKSKPDTSFSASKAREPRLPFSKPFHQYNLQHNRSSDNIVPQIIAGQSGNMPSPPPLPTESASALLRQNQELRQRLQEEANSYRRRIDTYKQAQQNQATLVSRLQSKVQQYRQRCSDLESQMHETIIQHPHPPLALPHHVACSSAANISTGPITSAAICSVTMAHSSQPCSSSLESPPISHLPCGREFTVHEDSSDLCRKLEEEHARCEHYIAQNAALRQQLEESNRTNEALTNDLQKITNDWSTLRDELLIKEDEYKEEEQAFKDYYNNEQNRLLKMWREVVTVKRSFKDMQAAMKNEIGQMEQEVKTFGKNILGACSTVSFNANQLSQNSEESLRCAQKESDDLKGQLATVRIQYESAQHEIKDRDQRLHELMQQLKKLENHCAQVECQASHANRLNDEIERLNHILREIAQAVVQDSEMPDRQTDDVFTGGIGVPLHQTAAVRDSRAKSPHRISARNSQAFAESTLSAVQAALNKYQLALHDLQVKLHTTNENVQTSKSQLDAYENTKSMLNSKISQLTETLESSNSKISELLKERDNLQKTLETTRSQKQICEQGRIELNTAFENLSNDYEKLQLANGKLQKRIDSLEEDKKAVELEIQRILKDKSITEMNLRSEEDRGSRLREDTISLREELNKLCLSRDLLEQQHIESENLISLLEKQKSDLEFDLDKLLVEKCELQEKLDKFSSSNVSALEELKTFQSELSECQVERKKLRIQCAEQSNEIITLKKELSSIDKKRLNLETENLSLSEKFKFLQIEREKIQQDLACMTRDRTDIHNQLTAIVRKKEALNEELMRTRQRLEQANETNNRLNRNMETMVKDVEDKQMTIELNEKELHRLQELLASLRSEKESLESVLFDTNNSLEATEEKRSSLEKELQEALVREESLKNSVARLAKDFESLQRKSQETKTQLINAARIQENDFAQKITNLQAAGEENAKRYAEENMQLRNALEKQMQQALQALQIAKDDEIEKLQERLITLQNNLENLVQQHEETMIRAENEKQQSLLMAHREKQSIIEKLEFVSQNLKAEQEAIERAKRDFDAMEEKHRTTIAQFKDEIVSVRTKEEENKTKLEDEIRKQEIQLTSLREERDNFSRLAEELKMELRLKEDKIDALKSELQEYLRKNKEAESYIENLRKELTDNRRALADCNIEREKYSNSNRDLREHIKRVEGAKREQARAIEEALQKISTLEDSKNSLENEKTRLTTLLKESENQLTKTVQDLSTTKNTLIKTQMEFSQKDDGAKELESKLTTEIEIKERTMQELEQVKKQLIDLEGNLCATRQELGRLRCHANQEEHRYHNREQELIARLEEARCREKRIEDQKHNLEVCLADATQQIQELKARLGATEGRIRALDEQLACVETHKRDAEHKLSSIAHSLRRIAGIQFDGTVNLTHRLAVPSRRYSPIRSSMAGSCGHDCETRIASNSPDGPIDVDPDLVRKGIRNLIHQVAQIEREKDDYKTQLNAARKQLQDAADQQIKCESKVSKLQQIMRHLQEEKSTLVNEKNMKSSVIQSLEEKLKQKSDECQQLREKLVSLNMQLGSGQEENTQNEERLEKCRQHVAKLEMEKRQLQEELAKAEGRGTKLDLQRVQLEGDITRLQMVLQEKDSHIRQMQERLDNQTRSAAQLEDRCTSLKTTVDQLKDRLQKSALIESELRGDIKTLNKQLTEQGHCSQANEDKMNILTKSLQAAENEKRILSERLDNSQAIVNELRLSQQAKLDSVQRLQEQITDLEVQRSALESKLRIAKWKEENNEMGATGGGNNSLERSGEEEVLERQLRSSQREKSELRSKLQALQDKVKQLESERKSKFSGHGGDTHFDRSEKSIHHAGAEYDSNRTEHDNYLRGVFNCGLDHSIIEQENRDLRVKVRRLETQLAEKESELARCKARMHDSSKCFDGDSEQYRNAQKHAEKLLDAREQAHRQQILRLENQISMLREQLAQEAKRRQQYILRSSKANREMQYLRNTLGESLRHVSQHPLDPTLLENESRRLDTAVTMSLPPSSCRDYDRE